MGGEEHKNAPKTVQEIGIHIGYIREDLQEIKVSLADSPSRGEFNNLEKRVTKIEANIAKVVWAIVMAFLASVTGLVFGITNN